jgi:gamma-glutamylcyclotransferase (GGCT)/AIG2-like uncharacterized protein YtfP
MSVNDTVRAVAEKGDPRDGIAHEKDARAVPVFVYGTLKPGQLYWPRISAWVVYTEEASVRGELFDTVLGYPAAVFGDNDVVEGVLLHVPAAVLDKVLAVMDEIEVEGKEYRRVRVLTLAGVEAIAYEWMGPTEGMRPLSGPWSR